MFESLQIAGSRLQNLLFRRFLGKPVRLLRAGASAIGVNTAVRSLGVKTMTTIDREVIANLDTLPLGQDTLQHIIGAETVRGPKKRCCLAEVCKG